MTEENLMFDLIEWMNFAQNKTKKTCESLTQQATDGQRISC